MCSFAEGRLQPAHAAPMRTDSAANTYEYSPLDAICYDKVWNTVVVVDLKCGDCLGVVEGQARQPRGSYGAAPQHTKASAHLCRRLDVILFLHIMVGLDCSAGLELAEHGWVLLLMCCKDCCLNTCGNPEGQPAACMQVLTWYLGTTDPRRCSNAPSRCRQYQR